MTYYRFIMDGDPKKGALHVTQDKIKSVDLHRKNLKWLKVPENFIYWHKPGTYEFWFKRRGMRLFKSRVLFVYKNQESISMIQKSIPKRFLLYEDEYQVIIARPA